VLKASSAAIITWGDVGTRAARGYAGDEESWPWALTSGRSWQDSSGAGRPSLSSSLGPAARRQQWRSANYARPLSTLVAAKVTIGPGRRNLAGQVRRLVTASWGSGGRAQTDIGPEEPVDW
jgi:hypothetical protein